MALAAYIRLVILREEITTPTTIIMIRRYSSNKKWNP